MNRDFDKHPVTRVEMMFALGQAMAAVGIVRAMRDGEERMADITMPALRAIAELVRQQP